MDKNRIGNRFRTDLQKVGGAKFKGVIYRPSISNDKGQNLSRQTRILKVSKNTSVELSDVIEGKSKTLFICADNGDGEVLGYDYKTFRLFLVDDLWDIERRVKTTDPVTGLETGTTFEKVGEVYVSSEPSGRVMDRFNITQPKQSLILSAEVKLGDRLNGKYTVERLEKRLGVFVAEVI